MSSTNDRQSKSDKTAKLVGLFLATVLALTPGCSSEDEFRHVHVDKNGDGYCDVDGEPMESRHRTYYRSPIWGGSYGTTGGYQNPPASNSSSSATRISAGTSGMHGGLGSSGISSGG